MSNVNSVAVEFIIESIVERMPATSPAITRPTSPYPAGSSVRVSPANAVSLSVAGSIARM